MPSPFSRAVECHVCGYTYVPGVVEQDEAHAGFHDVWMNGSVFPPDPTDRVIAIVDGLELIEAASSDSAPYRRRFWDAALRARLGTDFPTPYDGGDEEARWDGRAYVLRRHQRAVALAVVRRRERACWIEWSDYEREAWPTGPAVVTKRRMVDFVWVLPELQQKGLGTAMIAAICKRLGVDSGDLGWATPLTAGGERLVRRLCSNGFWGAP